MPKAQRCSNPFPRQMGGKGHPYQVGARGPSHELLKLTGGCSHARGTRALQAGLQVIPETGLTILTPPQHDLPEQDVPH